jgi:alpha-mannosidase
VEAPSYGVGTAADTAPDVARATEQGDGVVLENDLLRAELTRDGRLVSLVHRAADREALEAPGNVFQLYDDRPTAYEAWDIDPFHLETARDAGPAESCAVVQASGLRAQVELRYRFGTASTLRQLVRLDAGASRLDFHCEVDWRERRTMLKVLFPVAVHSSSATYQMQFGHAERPTHFSTSHDLARYEVPGHRFADLSEHGFGVALLTDCKYGYSTLGGEMRISRAWWPRRRGSRRRCGGPRARVGRGHGCRSMTPTWCSTPSSGPRSPTPCCCGCTRPTVRGAGRACMWAGRPPRRCRATCSRTPASRCAWTTA